jgi:N-acetylmuramoyl-L-alanine amidase
MDLANRVKIAQETDDCIFVSIHMNSFPESKYNGLQIYYSKNNPSSRVLAEDIQLAIKNELQPNNKRKISEASSKIFILDRLTCPAVLIECGFLSNAEECRLLCTEIYQNQLSEIIAEKIQKYVEKNPQTY